MPERPSSLESPTDDHHDAGKDGDAVSPRVDMSPRVDILRACHWYLASILLSLTRLQMNSMCQRAPVNPRCGSMDACTLATKLRCRSDREESPSDNARLYVVGAAVGALLGRATSTVARRLGRR
jgi:hypothetical protein